MGKESEENGDNLDWLDLETTFPPGSVVLLKPTVLRRGFGLLRDERTVLSKFWRRVLGALGCAVLR